MQILTFLYTFTDTVRLLEEVVMVALATAIQEVFAFSHILVIVPAWEGALTGSHNRSHSALIYRERDRHDQLLTFENLILHSVAYREYRAGMMSRAMLSIS